MSLKRRLSELVREAFFCPDEFLYIECEDCPHNESGLCLMMGEYMVKHGVRIPVFCKDCESACPVDDKDGLVCTIWGAPTEPSRYCSEGERRNDDV